MLTWHEWLNLYNTFFCFDDALSSIQQLCSAPEPEMAILWSGTPGAAKKVRVRKLFLNRFVRPSFFSLWDFRLNLLGNCRTLGPFDTRQRLWPCFCPPLRRFLQTGEADQRRSQQGGGDPPHQGEEEAGKRTRHGSLCGEFHPKLTETLLVFNQLFFTTVLVDLSPCRLHPEAPKLRQNTPSCRFWGCYINYRHRAALIYYLDIS